MRTHRIAAISADGIGPEVIAVGPEVIAAGLEALDTLATCDGGFALQVDHYDWAASATAAPAR